MKDYVKLAQDLALDKKKKEEAKQKAQNERSQWVQDTISNCKKAVKEGLKQWDDKYGLSFDIEDSKSIKILKDKKILAEVVIHWDHWKVDWSDDCRNCDEEGVVVKITYLLERYSSHNWLYSNTVIENSGHSITNTYYSADSFLESFAHKMAQKI